MAKKKVDATVDPSVPSAAWLRMEPKWRLISTLLGGTMSMREAAEDYLPQHDSESQANYNERLGRCTLYNMMELTLDSLVGKVFVEPLVMSTDVPPQIAALSEDVDLQGNDISVFCRDAFRMSLAKTVVHVLVDMPTISPEARMLMSREDDLKANHRPYWTIIDPENMIFQYAEVIAGKEVLQQVRILEEVTELVGFAQVSKPQIRILRPGTWETWRLSPDEKEKIWVPYDNGTYDLDEIPLWSFYANRTGLGEGKPPLEDLAHLNVRHWQSTSDQINILTVARFPMLACSGATADNGGAMKIGPRQVLGIREPNGKFYYVEHDGRAIKSGADDLQDLEEKMAAYGAEFLRRKLAGVTATERALDLAETMSTLRDTANRFADGVGRLLELTGRWLRMSGPCGSVRINTDYIQRAEDDVDLQILTTAYEAGALTHLTYLKELQRHDVLSPDLDLEKETKEAQAEMAARLTVEAKAKAAGQPPAPANPGSMGATKGGGVTGGQ